MTLALRTVRATRYVTPLREGGSLPGLVEADDDGLYVVKFRGAAQGPLALVAELLAGELARAVGILVPELVLVEVDPALGEAEPSIWARELLEASPGLNIGLDFLPGSLTYSPAADAAPSPELAADIVWLDSLVTNPDRTPRNPNILAWHRRLWCIDHGAALYVHHTWREPDAHAERPLAQLRDHVLLPFRGSLDAAHERLAPLVTAALLDDLVSAVPDAWLAADSPAGDRDGQRRAYVTYLRRRVEVQPRLLAALERERIDAG